MHIVVFMDVCQNVEKLPKEHFNLYYGEPDNKNGGWASAIGNLFISIISITRLPTYYRKTRTIKKSICYRNIPSTVLP